MGRLVAGGDDQADRLVEGQLATVGAVSAPLAFVGTANVSCWATGGATGGVVVERSFDGGTTWLAVTNLGAVVNIPAGASETIFGREAGVLWRLRRATGTGATLFARLSQ